MVKDDFTTVIVKKAIDSIIKYAFRPDLVKNRRRNFSEAAKKRVIQRQANLCNICGNLLDIKEFDHINGNPYDNSHFNCQALCPNCHTRLTRMRAKIRRKFRN